MSNLGELIASLSIYLNENQNKDKDRDREIFSQDLINIFRSYSGKDWFNYLKYFEHGCRKNGIYRDEVYDLSLYTFLPRDKFCLDNVTKTIFVYKIVYGDIVHHQAFRKNYLAEQVEIHNLPEGTVGYLTSGNHQLINTQKKVPTAILGFSIL